MHCKPPKLKVKQHMASVSGGGGGKDDDGDGSRSGKSVTLGHSPRSYASNNNNNNTNNNNNNNDSTSNTSATLDSAQIQLKKQTLEQRKQELEKLLSEKSWLLQQLQKQEAQILNGNYEYLNLNEIFGTLQQCKQDTASSSGSAVLRRKSTTAKENHNNNNNNIISANRHSEISNRSSEYDNYPGEQQVATQQLPPSVSGALKMVHKKRQMPITSNNWHAANTLPQVQQQQQQQQLRQHYISQMTEQQHFQYTQQQVLQHQQQQQQQRHLLQHQHFHPRQQLITAYHSPTLPAQPPDAISLYSANSANVATMRQQQPAHQPQMQTPIVVQCDKYYLSPTHQSYNDGGFIKSSQNIKQYVSPLASPTTSATATHMPHEQQQPVKPLLLHQQQHIVVSSRSFDAISLSPSFAAVMEPQSNNNTDVAHGNNSNNSNNQRWRSQSNIQYNTAGSSTELKTQSTDMLVNMHPSNASISNFYNAAAALKSKPLDEISLASFSSETQKKQKPKQWLESSLDGPAIRTSINNSPVNTPPRPLQAKPLTHNSQRERPRLSSQSMSSGAQRYHNVGQRGKATRLLQDDDGKYVKLSQSTSYLNSIDPLVVNTYFPDVTATPSPLPPREAAYNYLPTKSLASRSTAATADKPAISPEIRIESPKNMTVVQQATFQPYKEITKPFEMSDFYKYSTKFKQKEPVAATTLHKAETQEKS